MREYELKWGIMKKDNLVKASLVMLAFSILSKISGFLRELVFANYYGVSNITDAYITASTISTTIFAGLTAAVTMGYIPTTSLYNKDKVAKVTSNLINVAVVIICIVSGIVYCYIENIIPFFAVGFDAETQKIAVDMAKIILPSSFLYVVYNILNGYLQIKGTFWTVGVAVIINNFTNLVTFAVSKGNLDVLAYGFVLSWILPAVFLFIVSKFYDYKHHLTFNIKDESIKSIIKLGTPVFFGQLIFQFNTLIDRNFATLIGEGIMSNMKYANQLILFITTIFVYSIVTAIYPKISKLASENNLSEFKQIGNTTMRTILFFVLPITVAFFLLSNQIVELVFMRGEFDAKAVLVTANALKAYAFALPGICMVEVLNKMFYSLKDTKTPVMLTFVSLSVNIGLNFAFVNTLGYIGLALATGVANTVLTILLYFKLSSKIGSMQTKNLLKTVGKIAVSSIIMGIFVNISLTYTQNMFAEYSTIGNLVEIGVSAIIGAIIYFIMAYIFKVQELEIAIKTVKSKINKKKA